MIGFLRLGNLAMIALFLIAFDRVFLDALSLATHIPRRLDGFVYLGFVLDVVIVAMTGYWINDYFDVETDRVNRPQRMMVSNPLTKKQFQLIYGGMLLVGFLLTIAIAEHIDMMNWIVLYPATVLMLFAYARKGKRILFVSNVLVSLLIAVLPFIALIPEWPSLLVLQDDDAFLWSQVRVYLLGYVLLMFLSNLAREWTKDIEDMRGDQKMHAQTLPIVLGVNTTIGLIIASIIGVFAIEAWLALAMDWSGFDLIAALGVACLGLITLAALLMHSYRIASLILKILMLFGMIQLFLICPL